MAATTEADLHEIVRQQRRLSGLSQANLAKIAGVGKTVVFDLEHGKRSIRFDTLIKILSVLNINVSFQTPLIHTMPIQLHGAPSKTAKSP